MVKEILLPRFGHKYVLVRGVNKLALRASERGAQTTFVDTSSVPHKMRRPPLVDWEGQVLYEAIGVNALEDTHRIDWSSDQCFVDS